jgi:outer membrane protein assembly factor BamB
MMNSEVVSVIVSIDTPLAVVPIVVNAGAAVFPVILAAVSTFIALLFKPRELLRVCREKPMVPLVTLGIAGLVGLAVAYWPASDTGTGATQGRRNAMVAGQVGIANAGVSGGVYVDWTRVALARIEAKQRSPRAVSAASPPPNDTTPSIGSSAETEIVVQSGQPFIFRGGNQRLGAIGEAPRVGLEKLWQHYPSWTDDSGVVSEDTEAMILSSAAVYGDRVYGASCLLDPPDTYGAIFCLDIETGKPFWSIDTAGESELKGFFSSPAISADGRFLVIGQGLHPDSNCELVCIETETGNVRWTLPTPLHLESSPVINGDVVYIGAGAIEDPTTHVAMSHPGFVLAASVTDGRELWRHDVADPESSPVVRDGVLYIGSGFNGKAVVALRTDPLLDADPRELWRTPTPYPITGAITLLGDRVIAGGGNGDFVYRDPKPAGVVMALDAKTGDIDWQSEMPDAVLGAVAAGERLVCGVASGEVMALDPNDGKKIWASRISGIAPVLAAPAVTASEVFAVSQDGYLARLDLATGRELEKVYINSEEKPGAQGLSISSPLVVHGKLFVGSETGGLRAYAGGVAQ